MLLTIQKWFADWRVQADTICTMQESGGKQEADNRKKRDAYADAAHPPSFQLD